MSFSIKNGRLEPTGGSKKKIGGVLAGEKDDEVVIKKQLDDTLPYKVYVATLSQAGTDDPVATVLNAAAPNYLGDVVWTRTGTGSYYGTLTGQLTVGKTWFVTGNEADCSTATYINNINTVQITTFSAVLVTSDNMMFNLAVEIRVYN